MDRYGPRASYGSRGGDATPIGTFHTRSSAPGGGGGGGGWSNHHGHNNNSNSDNGNGGSDEQELATRTISIYPKRFYLDVKENNRGRFIKMAEIGFGRKKSRLILAMSAAAEFRDKLGEVIAAASQLPPRSNNNRTANTSISRASGYSQPPDGDLILNHQQQQKDRVPSGGSTKRKQEQTTTSSDDSGGRGDNSNSGGGEGSSATGMYGSSMSGYGGGNDEDDRLVSTAMVRDNRRYFFDLKENYRGRFLRISQSGTSGRTTIAIPAEGLSDFQAVINELLQGFARPADLEPAATVANGSDTLSSGSALAGNSHFGPLLAFRPDAELPESTVIRHRDKSFYFDVRRNPRGVFLRLTEAKAAQRTQLVIPDQLWPRFFEIFKQFNTHLQQNSVTTGGEFSRDELVTSKASNADATPSALSNGEPGFSSNTSDAISSSRSSTASVGASFGLSRHKDVGSNIGGEENAM